MEFSPGDVSGGLENDAAPSNLTPRISSVLARTVSPTDMMRTTRSFGQSGVLGNPTSVFGRPSLSADLSGSTLESQSGKLISEDGIFTASERHLTSTLTQSRGFWGFGETTPRPVTAGVVKPNTQRKIERPAFRAGDECVAFIIGDGKEFQVHKAFATHYSIKLKTAFEDQSCIEFQTKSYRVNYASEETVSLLVQWIYTQSLNIESVTESDSTNFTNHLARLWVLAGDLEIPRLQNTVIDRLEHLRRTSGQRIPPSELEFLYGNTSAGSALRKYIVDDFANNSEADVFLDNPENIPKEMLLELAVYFKKNMVHKQMSQVFGLPAARTEKDLAQFFVAEV